jgi:hypothetical protein
MVNVGGSGFKTTPFSDWALGIGIIGMLLIITP